MCLDHGLFINEDKIPFIIGKYADMVRARTLYMDFHGNSLVFSIKRLEKSINISVVEELKITVGE